MAQQEDTRLTYDPAVYQTEAWFETLGYTDEWNQRALFAVLAILGKPDTFIDLGCGDGMLVATLQALEDPRGPRAYSVGVELWLPPGIDHDSRFIAADLRNQYDYGRRFDLVTCWEVAEHLPEEAADTFCDNVARHVAPGGHLVWTAAPPGQGGDHHVNEQPPEDWRERLHARGLVYDMDLTGKVQTAWQWVTGPCFWLPQNVMVFRRDT